MGGRQEGQSKGERIRYVGRQVRSSEGQENEWKYSAARSQENLKKVPETRNVRGSQDSMGVTLAKMPNSGEMEPDETTSGR